MTLIELLKETKDKDALLKAMRVISGMGNRKVLLALMDKEPQCVGELAKSTGYSANIVSHRLRSLRKAALVKSARQGKQIYYILA